MNHTPARDFDNTDFEQKGEAFTFANLMDRIISARSAERDLALGQHDPRMSGLLEMASTQLQLQSEAGVVQSTHKPRWDTPQPLPSTGNVRQKVKRAFPAGFSADHSMLATNDRKGYLQ